MLIEFALINRKNFLFLLYPIFKGISDLPLKLYIKEDNDLFYIFKYFMTILLLVYYY